MKTFKKRKIVIVATVGFLISMSACGPTDSVGVESPTIAGSPDSGITRPEEEDFNFIIGGKSVSAHDPVKESIVGLLDIRQGSLCTASIISEDILVTAAHCAEGAVADLKIKFGLVVSEKNLRPVDGVKISPLWKSNGSDDINTGDIAIVRFSGGLPNGFLPAHLLPSSYALKNNEMVLLAGYGLNDGDRSSGAGRLREVEIPISNAKFSKSEVSLDQTNGKGACHGDSGGPAFVKVGNVLQLWGVTSRGSGTAGNDCSGYSIYTRIVPYSRWINSAVVSLRPK